MIRQSQDVGSEGLGVQAGGDVNVQYGPNALQMAEIISAISTQMAVFYADGQVKVEQRLQQFKEDVFKEFAKEEISNPRAFSDPDFQACVGDAQKGYIRANDETVSASLINLLAERSRFSERGRPSLILNSAINVVGNLTAEEINSITLIFFIKKTHKITGNASEVLDYYVDFVAPLLNSLNSNSSSNEYLFAHGCLSSIPFQKSSFISVVKAFYECAFCEPFTETEFEAECPSIEFSQIEPLLSQPPKSFLSAGGPLDMGSPFRSRPMQSVTTQRRFSLPNLEKIVAELRIMGLESAEGPIGTFVRKRTWTEEAILEALTDASPVLARLPKLWADCQMDSFFPTALGIAVAHSNARRIFPSFRVPLTTWVQ